VALRITIVGLGLVGSSMGLALKKSGANQSRRGGTEYLEIVGHDKSHEAARNAHKIKCVDRTEWNLISACDGADLVVISTPLAEIKTTLAAIAAELKEGCVVTDTASLKIPVLNWAGECLPGTAPFVGGHPILGKLDAQAAPATLSEPSASLFEGAVYCLTPAPNAPSAAMQRVSDLVEALGATPYFMDPAEHDGLVAVGEQLPLLMALALQDVAQASPAHREIARLSGAEFDHVTQPLAGDARQLSEVCDLNAANIARWMDALLSRLSRLRESLAHPPSSEEQAQEREWLEKAFSKALEARARWSQPEGVGRETDYSDFSAARMMLGDAFRSRPKDGEKR